MKSLLFILLFSSLCFSADLTISWEEPDQPDSIAVRGYRIYYGFESSGVYSNTAEVDGNTLVYHLNDVEPGRVFYCAVTAFNNAGESEKSEEVSLFVTETRKPQKAEIRFLGDNPEPEIIGNWQDYPDNVLDVLVDGQGVDWGELNGWHSYTYDYVADGSNLVLRIYDTDYSDNLGELEFTVMQGNTLLWHDFLDARLNEFQPWVSPQPIDAGTEIQINITGTYIYWQPDGKQLKADAEWALSND